LGGIEITAMLYVFHGSLVVKSIEKAHALVDSLRAKRPDAAFVKVNGDDWSSSVIEEHLGGQGLFSNKYIIMLDRVTENAEAKENFLGFIPAMHGSANIFIVCEGKSNAELKRAFEKNAEKVIVSDEPSAASSYGRKDFNIFALADAVGSKDKMKAWIIYREAIKSGLESESILGTLFWQAKSMALADGCRSAGEAGLKPFIFDKSKRYARNYSKEELGRLLKDIIVLYHDGHRGMVDMESGIERLLIR
jgi:DNA polymerase III delta subunit